MGDENRPARAAEPARPVGYGEDFPHLWCAGLPGAQEALTGSAPDRYFRPPYVGHRGWIGVRLDGDVDWAELTELCADAYRAVAPAKLAAQLDTGHA